MPDVLAEHQHRLDAEMEACDAWPADSVWVRQAMAVLPRHVFAPERLWEWSGRAWQPVDRGTDPERWAGRVYAGPYEPAVTQLADGLPSSSLSCPSVVADMLDVLAVEPGHRVLELGTGTGWNAALLGWRAGRGRVVSVETGRALAEQAQQRLTGAGVDVAVVVGDGGRGWLAGAPYDRVISTYAVEVVPWAWVAQCRPGGRIVTPWGRLGHVGLTVAEDGRCASGRVRGLAQFMPARGTATGRRWAEVRGDGEPEDERPVGRDLQPLHADWTLKFALRVMLPEVQIRTAVDEDGVNAWLHDGASSWAMLAAVGGGQTVAYQGGPRRLADALEAAWEAWDGEGRPSVCEWGMTVAPDGQYMWLRDRERGRRWPAAPAAASVA